MLFFHLVNPFLIKLNTFFSRYLKNKKTVLNQLLFLQFLTIISLFFTFLPQKIVIKLKMN